MPSEDPTAVESPPPQEPVPGPRFEFGKNWQAFLSVVDERRIELAKTSLEEMLKVDLASGKFFQSSPQILLSADTSLLSFDYRKLPSGTTVYAEVDIVNSAGECDAAAATGVIP